MNIPANSMLIDRFANKITIQSEDTIQFDENTKFHYLQSDNTVIKRIHKLGNIDSHDVAFTFPLYDELSKTCSCGNTFLKGYLKKNTSGTFFHDENENINTLSTSTSATEKKIHVYYCTCNSVITFRKCYYNY